MCEFVALPEYENLIEVCRCGNVYRAEMAVRSPQSGGERVLPRRKCKQRLVKGYPSVTFCLRGKKKTLYVHRLIAMAFIDNPDDKPCINHKDGDKENFSIQNLEWCTHKENMSHAFESGLIPYKRIGPGESSMAAKLTEVDVKEIKQLIRQGQNLKEIAQKFGVRAGTIGHIKAGRTWVGVGE